MDQSCLLLTSVPTNFSLLCPSILDAGSGVGQTDGHWADIKMAINVECASLEGWGKINSKQYLRHAPFLMLMYEHSNNLASNFSSLHFLFFCTDNVHFKLDYYQLYAGNSFS